MVEIRVLGPLQVRAGGRPLAIGNAGKRRLVLAILLARAGEPVPTDTLIAQVWDGRPPASARRNLQLYVHQLRRMLGDELITARGDAYAIDPGDALDMIRFRRLAAAGGRLLDAGDPATAARSLRSALDLWQGEAFGEFLACDLVAEAAARLALLRLETYERWAEAQLRAGATARLATELTELCQLHPYREGLRALLMRALYQTGRRVDALAVFRETRALLVEEIGLEPGPALRRLHEAMLRGDDVPVAGVEVRPAASSAVITPPAPRQLPAPPQKFTGRLGELSSLEQPADVSTVVISAIDGMAGVGKTALAVHAAHRIADRYPDGQLFIDLHGYTQGVAPVEPADALDRMLCALGLPATQIPAELDERATLYRTQLADKRMLIVLDNAATEAQVAPLLPGAPGCRVLVTSRRRLAGLDHTRVLSLDTLPRTDAIALLVQTAGEDRLTGQPPDLMAELVELCGYLPLAIRIAGARLRSHPSWSGAHLAQRLRDQQHRLAELEAGQRSITAALDLSYQDLRADEQLTYRRLGLQPGPDIDTFATAALLDSTLEHAGRMLEQLLDANLLLEPVAGRFRFHDLIRAHAAHTDAAADTRPAGEALGRLLAYYRHTAWRAKIAGYPHERDERAQVPGIRTPAPDLPDPDTALDWLDTELPNLLAAARYAAGNGLPEPVLDLSSILDRHLRTRCRYQDAETLHHHALAAARAARRPAAELDALAGLANAHRRRGRYEQAVGFLEQGLRTAREIGHRRGELDALIRLGHIHWLQGRNERAVDHLAQALRIARTTGDRASHQEALTGLGHIHASQGRYEPAVDHLEQALQVARAASDRPGELHALSGLGDVRRRQGRYEQAAGYLEQGLQVARATGHRAGELNALASLAYVHLRQGRYEQASATYQQLLDPARQVGDRNLELEAWHGLGRVQHATGNPNGAIAHHQRALALADELGQPTDLARAHDGLAHAHRALRQLSQARSHWQHALDILNRLGVDHTDDEETNVATIRAQLAGLPPV